MKATELRIGNLLYYKGIGEHGIITVDEIKEGLYTSCEGISLTEEWLFKFGLNTTDFFHEQSFRINQDEDFGWTITVQSADHKKQIEFSYFKYVYQLQNLYFALTGEELSLTKHIGE